MACCVTSTKPLSEPILESVNLNHRKNFQWNIKWNSNIFIQETAFENVICKTAVILSRPQCVIMNYFLSNYRKVDHACNQSEYPISWAIVQAVAVRWYANLSYINHKLIGLTHCSLVVPLSVIDLTLNVRGPSYLGLTRSLSWLLMPWLLTLPRHQHPWYWLCRICKSLSYLCHIDVE